MSGPGGMLRVYPRGCGGARRRGVAGPPARGLSPRVRGSPTDDMPCEAVGGSIPAGAGEPWPHATEPHGCRVYPRGCGGASLWGESNGTYRGLSPRVRGSPERKGGIG